MARSAIPTWFFAMAVVRKGHRFLLVHERKHGQGWYLPAGRVEAGESFVDAAVRETLEESGVPIVVEGILRVEHSPSAGDARCRVFVLGRPLDDTAPRTTPNEHSLEAAWVSLDELSRYPLRGSEVRDVMEYVLRGGAVHPLSLLTAEGERWR